ncbi:hypothetical protein PENSPDRAFT_333698 [Peniophora sp. CONT]|nr:hypothetical protein PENSPDRAFT_333698 [Peniophora sp. CONT]
MTGARAHVPYGSAVGCSKRQASHRMAMGGTSWVASHHTPLPRPTSWRRGGSCLCTRTNEGAAAAPDRARAEGGAEEHAQRAHP